MASTVGDNNKARSKPAKPKVRLAPATRIKKRPLSAAQKARHKRGGTY